MQHLQIIFRATMSRIRSPLATKKSELIEVQRKAKRRMFNNLSVYALRAASFVCQIFIMFSASSFVIVSRCLRASTACNSFPIAMLRRLHLRRLHRMPRVPKTNHDTADYLFINAYLNHLVFISLFHISHPRESRDHRTLCRSRIAIALIK